MASAVPVKAEVLLSKTTMVGIPLMPLSVSAESDQLLARIDENAIDVLENVSQRYGSPTIYFGVACDYLVSDKGLELTSFFCEFEAP